jgi:hypothetical protein
MGGSFEQGNEMKCDASCGDCWAHLYCGIINFYDDGILAFFFFVLKS